MGGWGGVIFIAVAALQDQDICFMSHFPNICSSLSYRDLKQAQMPWESISYHVLTAQWLSPLAKFQLVERPKRGALWSDFAAAGVAVTGLENTAPACEHYKASVVLPSNSHEPLRRPGFVAAAEQA